MQERHGSNDRQSGRTRREILRLPHPFQEELKVRKVRVTLVHLEENSHKGVPLSPTTYTRSGPVILLLGSEWMSSIWIVTLYMSCSCTTIPQMGKSFPPKTTVIVFITRTRRMMAKRSKYANAMVLFSSCSSFPCLDGLPLLRSPLGPGSTLNAKVAQVTKVPRRYH